MACDSSSLYIPPEMWLHIISTLHLNDLVSFGHTSKYNFSIMIVDLRKRYCSKRGKSLVAADHPKVNDMIKFLDRGSVRYEFSLFFGISSFLTTSLGYMNNRLIPDEVLHHQRIQYKYQFDLIPDADEQTDLIPQKQKHLQTSMRLHKQMSKQTSMRPHKHKRGFR
jgi:hypothetical protein